jgi:hypothetical protein
MTNRYVTEKEKEGTKRRMEEYRQRLAATGIKTRAYQLNEAEHEAVKAIIAKWRSHEKHEEMTAEQLINLR